MPSGSEGPAHNRIGARTDPLEQAVAFFCIPREGSVTHVFRTTIARDPILGDDRLVDYQFAHDAEVHGVPFLAFASNESPKKPSEVGVR